MPQKKTCQLNLTGAVRMGARPFESVNVLTDFPLLSLPRYTSIAPAHLFPDGCLGPCWRSVCFENVVHARGRLVSSSRCLDSLPALRRTSEKFVQTSLSRSFAARHVTLASAIKIEKRKKVLN